MWDDARQLDAIAKGLALLSVAALLWAAVAWAARQPPFAFREVVVRGNARPCRRCAARVRRSPRARRHLFHDESRERARLARQAALGSQCRAAPPVAAAARSERRGAHAFRSMERNRARRHLRRRVRCRIRRRVAAVRGTAGSRRRSRSTGTAKRARRSRRSGSRSTPFAFPLGADGKSARRVRRAGSRSSWAAKIRRRSSNASSPRTTARSRRSLARGRASSTSICVIATVSRPACRDSANVRRKRRTRNHGEGSQERDRRPRHRDVEDRRDRRRGDARRPSSTSSGSARSRRAASRRVSSSISRRRWRRSSASSKRRS